jgi:hypothetical protein
MEESPLEHSARVGGAEGQAAAAPDKAARVNGARLTRIAERAHELFLARGGQHGADLQDWLQAEREIDQQS